MYGTESGVAAIVPGAHLDAISTPDMTDVTAWLGEGAAEIDVALSAAGYGVPVDGSATVYARLTALNNLYAGAYVLRSRGIDVLVGESEMRSDVWLREFREGLASLVAIDLTGVGVSLRPVTSTRQRRVRTLQMRRVDGYSGAAGYGASEYTAGGGITE